jgi:hypothetical protein
MCDRVSVGVQEGGVPIAEGFVAFGGVGGEAEVATGDVEFGVLTRHHDGGGLGVGAVVTGAGFGHVDDGGVVKHAAVSFVEGKYARHTLGVCDLTPCNSALRIISASGTSGRISSGARRPLRKHPVGLSEFVGRLGLFSLFLEEAGFDSVL